VGSWILTISALLLFAPIAGAGEIGDAKAAGQVAEGPDGFVHVVDHGATDVQALVKDVNAKRKARYNEIAKSQGAPLAAVAAQAGEKLLNRVPPGQYVMDAQGNFRKK
jgi:hypothetical protein